MHGPLFELSEIIKDKLYLSGHYPARRPELMKKITYVIKVGKGYVIDYGLPFYEIDLEDHTTVNIMPTLTETYEILRRLIAEGECVLVHCVAGVSRSPAIVAYYLMKERGITATQAIEDIKAQRPIIDINHGFLTTLMSIKIE